MLCTPPSAVCTAHCPGTLEQSRSDAEQLETSARYSRCVVLAPAEIDPAGAKPAGAVHLGEPAERRAERVLAQRRDRHVLGAVVEDAVVDLVREEHELLLLGDAHQRLDDLARIDRAGGVVGVDEHQRLASAASPDARPRPGRG